MQEVILPEGTEEITADQFRECRTLTKIIIPETVTRIADKAFEGCDALTELVIPSSVQTIGRYICSGCTNLKKFVMHGTARFDRSWLDGCIRLTNIELAEESGVTVWQGAVYNPDRTELIYIPYALEKLILPVTVESAYISGKIKILCFYAYQHIEIRTDSLEELHFFTEQKEYRINLAECEDELTLWEEEYDYLIAEFARAEFAESVIAALQTGKIPDDLAEISYCDRETNEKIKLRVILFPFRLYLAEIIAECYHMDRKELCCQQTADSIGVFYGDRHLPFIYADVFLKNMQYLFCLENYPEWKNKVLEEWIGAPLRAIQNALAQNIFDMETIRNMIDIANQKEKYETQVLLMNYQHEKYGSEDIAGHLKL